MSRVRSHVGRLVALAVLAAGAARPGVAQLRYSGGLSYSQGSYFFDETVGSVYWSNRVSFQRDRLQLSVSLPFVFQQEGAVTWIGGTPLPTGGEQHGLVAGRGTGATVGTGKGRRRMTEPTDSVVFIDSGYSASVGDPLLAVTADLHSGFGFIRSVRASGYVKAPLTELGEGAGTGEWDYGGGLSLTAGVGRALAFVDGTYWWIGDLAELELLDGLSYAAGVSVPAFGDRGMVLFGVSGSSKTIPTADLPVSVDAAIGFGVGEHGLLSVGLGLGLTESAPDFTIQAGWSWG